MAHTHTHEIDSQSGVSTIKLLAVLLLNLVITAAELIGGVLANSLSLISDAMHNLSDGMAVAMSYGAIKLGERESTPRHTFGFRRAEVLAALINSVVLLIVVGYLFAEAYERFMHPHPVDGAILIPIASIGLVANVTATLLLRRDAKHSMNLRSSYLHLFSDAMSSVGVVAGGILMYLYGLYWIDPLVTVAIGIYILYESTGILLNALHIFMEGTPAGIDLEELKGYIESLPDVQGVHHVHVWSVGEKDIFMEGHVLVNDISVTATEAIIKRINEGLRHKFGITHITLQFECSGCGEDSLVAQCTEENSCRLEDHH